MIDLFWSRDHRDARKGKTGRGILPSAGGGKTAFSGRPADSAAKAFPAARAGASRLFCKEEPFHWPVIQEKDTDSIRPVKKPPVQALA